MGYEVGIITTIHTFETDLGFNPHVHALVTEGAIDKFKELERGEDIYLKIICKSWEKVILGIVQKENLDENRE